MKANAFRVCKMKNGIKVCNWSGAFMPGLLQDDEFIEVAPFDGDWMPLEDFRQLQKEKSNER